MRGGMTFPSENATGALVNNIAAGGIVGGRRCVDQR